MEAQLAAREPETKESILAEEMEKLRVEKVCECRAQNDDML